VTVTVVDAQDTLVIVVVCASSAFNVVVVVRVVVTRTVSVLSVLVDSLVVVDVLTDVVSNMTDFVPADHQHAGRTKMRRFLQRTVAGYFVVAVACRLSFAPWGCPISRFFLDGIPVEYVSPMGSQVAGAGTVVVSEKVEDDHV
jgi:hypothetical protein